MMKKIVLLPIIILSLVIIVINSNPKTQNQASVNSGNSVNQSTSVKPQVKKEESSLNIPETKILASNVYYHQTFNNCGPASLAMLLAYYNISETQDKLGQELRPYQHPRGNNDDKSVTLDELAEKAESYNLISYHRPNGNIDLIRKFIAQDIPVLTRTWLKANEDIGHYRIVKGYDDLTKELVQDDSLKDKNLRYSYEDFNDLWEKFNYEYLIFVPPEKRNMAETILGEDIDKKTAWQKAVDHAQKELLKNPNDIHARFNLSVAYYYVGDNEKSVAEFAKVEKQLSARTLWYQIEPIEAYYELKQYARVFSITDKILNNNNRAFSELYFLRGQIYLAQDKKEDAKNEFTKAVLYNSNFSNKIPTVN
jgi:tetratricopeptide (TPR) repeat protein